MSTNLYWEPAVRHRNTLGDQVKFILREYFRYSTIPRMDISNKSEHLRGYIEGVIQTTQCSEVKKDLREFLAILTNNEMIFIEEAE